MSNENKKWIFFSSLDDPDPCVTKRHSNAILWKGLIYAFLKLHVLFVLQLSFLLHREKKINQYIILGSQASHHHLNLFRFLNFNPNKATIINVFDRNCIKIIK